jgi:hypothetical protein
MFQFSPLLPDLSVLLNISRCFARVLVQMQKEVIALARKAVKESAKEGNDEKDYAKWLKTAMDKAFPNTTWHCIVGTHFAVSIAHATKNLIFLQVQHRSVLLFRSQD